SKDACWYIVRQELSFWKQCYAVSILEEYKQGEKSELNFMEYFEKKANQIKSEKGFKSFISSHRMLYDAYYYGLLKKVSIDYEDAIPTTVYYTIASRCNGEFEYIDSYLDILEKQIEKVFISSPLDQKYNDIRSEYKLYPLFLLLKVLIELGQITGSYRVSLEEFRVFVGTTKKYDEYLSTIYYILESRNKIKMDNVEFLNEYDKVKSKFTGNRF